MQIRMRILQNADSNRKQGELDLETKIFAQILSSTGEVIIFIAKFDRNLTFELCRSE
jgi:hypothetical protein